MSSIKVEFYCDIEKQTVKPSKETLRLINSVDRSTGDWVTVLDTFGDLAHFVSQLYDSFMSVDPDDKEAVKNYKTKEEILQKWAVE